jgi:hypothetical protein
VHSLFRGIIIVPAALRGFLLTRRDASPYSLQYGALPHSLTSVHAPIALRQLTSPQPTSALSAFPTPTPNPDYGQKDPPPTHFLIAAALRLHQYLLDTHSNGAALLGPDPGIRFNYRMGRFFKSYFTPQTRRDHYYYLQSQGYWILANWLLFDLTRQEAYREIAFRCSENILREQRPDGAWNYPNPEWRRRLTTVEGTWASLALLDTFRHTADSRLLAAALHWHEFLRQQIGFQRAGDGLAVNYFANRAGPRVPNNSALLLRFQAELAEAACDRTYLQPCQGLLHFLQSVQKPTGEFPYSVRGHGASHGRLHFQCFQYNAFQCLDLVAYCTATQCTLPVPMIARTLSFLSDGLTQHGEAYYACGNHHCRVTYHTAALAAAFHVAENIGIQGYCDLARQSYARLLQMQRLDGSYAYSRRDYWLLSDRRTYPRYLAMILYHLLIPVSSWANLGSGKDEAHPVVR